MLNDEQRIFSCMILLILVLWGSLVFLGLWYKQETLKYHTELEKITIERDLYKNLVEVEKDVKD